ncbi:flippase [Lapidilactobacillus gannanensis]|uniref:Flippase n=1 Tax=Lapidilactobacillus gannanensis TaxID=2486002 RepID=A0ABW4BPU5_9LACO
MYNMVYQVFVLIVPLITMPYISRVIGPTGVGVNTYTYAMTQYFVLFATLGINLYGSREIAYQRGNKEKLSKTFWEIETLLMTTAIIASLAFLVFLSFPNKYRLYYIAQGVAIIAVAFDISWFFMGIENFKVTVTRNILVKAISLACIFIFVKSKDDLFIYILITSLSILFGNITLWPYLKKHVEPIKLSYLHPLKHLRPSLVLFVPQIAINIYAILNKPMLKIFSSVESAGFFDSSDKIVKLLVALLTSLATVVMPRVANSFIRGDNKQIERLLTKSFDYISFLSIPLMFGIAAVAREFSVLFFGKAFYSVGDILLVESMVIPVIAWASITGNQYLLPTNHNKEYTISVIAGAVANLLLNVPLIMYWGAVGAAISTIISELVVTTIQLHFVNREYKVSKLFKGIYRYLLSGVVMFGIVYVLSSRWALSVKHLIIEVVLGAVIYFGLLLIMKTPILYEIIHRGLDRFNQIKGGKAH